MRARSGPFLRSSGGRILQERRADQVRGVRLVSDRASFLACGGSGAGRPARQGIRCEGTEVDSNGRHLELDRQHHRPAMLSQTGRLTSSSRAGSCCVCSPTRCRSAPGRWRAGVGARDRSSSGHDRRLRRDPDPRRDDDLQVRGSEVASPRPGDQLTVGAETFVVQGEPGRSDPDRLVWTLDVMLA